MNFPAAEGGGDEGRPGRAPPGSVLARVAMRAARARWFIFLRRVFQYQNGTSRYELGANPFDSSRWMVAELVALVVQIAMTVVTLVVSATERPVWPMRTWVVGYDMGCILSLLMLYWRYKHLHWRSNGGDAHSISDVERQSSIQESRTQPLVNKCRTSLDLFYAMWFVMGNVWVFDSRFGSFHRAPRLHVLCITLLAWNAIAYSFPFLLFVLLCICVPLVGTLIGYDISMASSQKGASEDQIAMLPSWKYKQVDLKSLESGHSGSINDSTPECCICLSKYKDKEEIRQLPCSHTFHQRCVDQWLLIISCCPLCKQALYT